MKIIAFSALSSLAGQEIGHSDWLHIDQARVNAFAEATLDRQWIHVDVARAERELGGTIAHGFLTLSLLPALSYALLSVEGCARTINYGLDRVRFTHEVRVGARIRVHQRCLDVQDKGDGKLVRMESRIELEAATKPACIAETLSLFFPHQAPP